MAKQPVSKRSTESAAEGHCPPIGTTHPKKKDLTHSGGSQRLSATSKRPGRPPKFTEAQKEDALARYMAGDSTSEIAAVIGCSERTVRAWASKGDWGSDLRKRRETSDGIEAQIHRLSRVKTQATLRRNALPCSPSHWIE